MLRTLLFAPANHARHVEKALSSAADGAILDLEDAVAVAEKPTARLAARRALAERSASARTKAYVRVNALTTPFAYEDLRAVVGPGLDGVVVPKMETPEQVATVDWLLHQLEREADLAAGSIDLLPIIETARGLEYARSISQASPRV